MNWKIFELFVTLALFLTAGCFFASLVVASGNGGQVVMDFNSVGEIELEFGLLLILMLMGIGLVGKKIRDIV